MKLNFFNDKEILITGGTGTLGKALIHLLTTQAKPKGIRVYSRDEMKQWQLKSKLKTDIPVAFLIGDVRNRERVYRAMEGVDIIIHAAAMKHVPMCEDNPLEAIDTNINGAANVVNAAIDMKVQYAMNVNTDKAVYPVNLYGATKLAAEKLFTRAGAYSCGGTSTKFASCRYGNVLGSRGSVLQLWKEQAENFGFITITDYSMTRFWVTVGSVAKFLLSAIPVMKAGEIFVPLMPSTGLMHLANIAHPHAEKKFTGIRPGEKLHETIVAEEEWKRCRIDNSMGVGHGCYVIEKNPFRNHAIQRPLTSENNHIELTENDLIEMLKEGML